MYLIISGTNRANSLTSVFSESYLHLLEEAGAQASLFSLESLPFDLLNMDVYEKGHKPASVMKIQQDFFEPASKFIFIFPEYNGSMPGSLKLLIDAMDPKLCFSGKKAGLVGLATGRAGNLRGLDHLAAVLMHMNTSVMPFLLPVSKVQFELEDGGGFKESTLKVVNDHIQRMLNF